MHSCFEPAELRMAIALNCYSLGLRVGKKTLLSLALTCKSFYEPCMDVLWREIEDLRPIICCLRAQIDNNQEDVNEDNGTSLLTLSPSAKNRIATYASRVKEYTPPYRHHFISNPLEDHRALLLIFHGSPLLPQVRYIRVGQVHPRNMPLARMLIHPGVRALCLQFAPIHWHTVEDIPLLYGAFFSTLPHMPSLVELELDLRNLGSELAANLTPQIIRAAALTLGSLQRLRLRPTSIHIVQSISSLSSLQELFLEIVSNYNISKNLTTPQQRIHGLQDLTIRCDWSEDVIYVLQSLEPKSPLQRVDIQIMDSPETLTQWVKIIDEMTMRFDDSTLKGLQIGDIDRDWGNKIDADDPEGTPLFSFTLAQIQPLFKFKAIDTLQIYCSGWLDLDDQSIEVIASSFPNATDIRLRGPHTDGTIPKVTLSGLLSIFKNRPNLEYFNIAFDARSLPQKKLEERYICPRLNLIGVQYSPIRNPLSVAAWLSDILPSNLTIEATGEGDQREKWSQVAKALPEFVGVRSEEIQRTKSTLIH